jgi:hypothetical protein
MVTQQFTGDSLSDAPIFSASIRRIRQFLDERHQEVTKTFLLFLGFADLDNIDVPVSGVHNKVLQANQPQTVRPPGNDNQIASHNFRLLFF